MINIDNAFNATTQIAAQYILDNLADYDSSDVSFTKMVEAYLEIEIDEYIDMFEDDEALRDLYDSKANFFRDMANVIRVCRKAHCNLIGASFEGIEATGYNEFDNDEFLLQRINDRRSRKYEPIEVVVPSKEKLDIVINDWNDCRISEEGIAIFRNYYGTMMISSIGDDIEWMFPSIGEMLLGQDSYPQRGIYEAIGIAWRAHKDGATYKSRNPKTFPEGSTLPLLMPDTIATHFEELLLKGGE